MRGTCSRCRHPPGWTWVTSLGGAAFIRHPGICTRCWPRSSLCYDRIQSRFEQDRMIGSESEPRTDPVFDHRKCSLVQASQQSDEVTSIGSPKPLAIERAGFHATRLVRDFVVAPPHARGTDDVAHQCAVLVAGLYAQDEHRPDFAVITEIRESNFAAIHSARS